MFTAYNVKSRQKNRNIHNAVITKTAKGAYMVQGTDSDEGGGDMKLTTLINKEKAVHGVREGWATTEDQELLELAGKKNV